MPGHGEKSGGGPASGYDEQFAMVKPWPIEIDDFAIKTTIEFVDSPWLCES